MWCCCHASIVDIADFGCHWKFPFCFWSLCACCCKLFWVFLGYFGCSWILLPLILPSVEVSWALLCSVMLLVSEMAVFCTYNSVPVSTFHRFFCALWFPCQACHFHLVNGTNSNALRFQILTDWSLQFASSDECITQLVHSCMRCLLPWKWVLLLVIWLSTLEGSQ